MTRESLNGDVKLHLRSVRLPVLKLFLGGAVAIALGSPVVIAEPDAAVHNGTYAFKSTYASLDSCDCVTQGIFAVWWDKMHVLRRQIMDRSFDSRTKAIVVAEMLTDVRNDCVDKCGMPDPPNPMAGYYYNVYLYDTYDMFRLNGWDLARGIDGNNLPYMTVPSYCADRGNKDFLGEAFCIFARPATPDDAAFMGDSKWYDDAAPFWYAVVNRQENVEGYVTAAAVTCNPQLPMWYTYQNREPGDTNCWQRHCHGYGMHTFLIYLTEIKKVPREVVGSGFLARASKLPQEHLYHKIGAAKFRDLYADYAAHNVGGFESFPTGMEARVAKELKQYGDAVDVHPVVQTYTDSGTGTNWYRPSHEFVTRGWGYNVYKIINSKDARYTFKLKGDAKGSEGAAAEFRGRIVIRGNGAAKVVNLDMTNAIEGGKEVEVKATDKEVYLVVTAVPEHFKGNQTYSYQVAIDRK